MKDPVLLVRCRGAPMLLVATAVFAGLLEQIAEHRANPEHHFQFTYGKQSRTF